MPIATEVVVEKIYEVVKQIQATQNGQVGGDASAANQLIENDSLSSIDTKLSSQATAVLQSALNILVTATNTLLTSLTALLPSALVGGRLDVNIGSPTIFPVSGTVTAVTGGLTETQLKQFAATLGVTVTSSAGATITLTMPAVPGMFHYITRIEIVAVTTLLAIVGTLSSATVTTTNLPGNPTYPLQINLLAGGKDKDDCTRTIPLRSSVANTNTTIICPATTNTTWTVNVEYYTGT